MEVIKHGNLKPMRFNCQKCCCEFIADMTEYEEAYSNGKKYLIVYCPECKNLVYEREEVDNIVYYNI